MLPLPRCRALSLAPPALTVAGRTPCLPAQRAQPQGVDTGRAERAAASQSTAYMHPIVLETKVQVTACLRCELRSCSLGGGDQWVDRRGWCCWFRRRRRRCAARHRRHHLADAAGQLHDLLAGQKVT